MLDQVLLQKAQEDVLARLVEAARNVATEDRQRFVAPNAPNRERYTFTIRVYPVDSFVFIQAMSKRWLGKGCSRWPRARAARRSPST